MARGGDLVVEGELYGDEIDDVAIGEPFPEAAVFPVFEEESLDEAVCEVAKNTAEEQGDGDFRNRLVEDAFFPKNTDHHHGDDGDDEEYDGCP